MTLNNFVTTVMTPRKNVGLLCPSIWWEYPLISIKVPFWAEMSCVIPDGYISLASGRKMAAGWRMVGVADIVPLVLDVECQWSLRAMRAAISCSRVRGYVVRSSFGANCAGFTKIERTVKSFSTSDFRTVGYHKISCYQITDWLIEVDRVPRDKWPSCRAPIVGT